MLRMPYRAGTVCLALLAGCVLGCGRSSSVHGVVTFEGDSVKNGAIIFLPADGKGPSAGGKIVDGAYRVDGLTAGKKTVQITAGADYSGPKIDPEELAQAKKKAAPPKQLVIPNDAIGNNAEVEIKSGDQSLDFNLTKPAPRKKR